MNKTDLKIARERYQAQSKLIQTLTYENLVKESADEQKKRVARLLKPENYIDFFDYYFGIDSGLPLADSKSAEFHQSSYEKVFKDRFIVQLRKWYRGSAKSIHTNVGNILHLKQNNELYFGLLIGQTGDHAKLLLGDIQMQFESNQRIIKDFGGQATYGNWSDGEFETKDGRFFKSLGLNQHFRGLRFGAHRPDFASVDDCEDRKRAKNKILTQDYGEKITGDLVKAFDLNRGRLIVPNNYIVKDGLLDFIKDKFKNSKHFDESIVNLADEKGNPSWPERITKEMVVEINEKTDYYTSQREDYNNPIEEGKLFKTEWIKYIKVHGNKRDWNGIILHWDLSYKKMGDYKACAILGFGDGKITILDVFCRKAELNEAIKWHYDKLSEYEERGMPINSFFDATATQAAVFFPVFKTECLRRGYHSIPMPSYVNTDKHLRIEATLTDVLFNGLLVVSQHLKDTPDWENGLNQLLSFEKGMSGHDDFPDTLEAAVRIGRQNFSLGGKLYSEERPTFRARKRGGF